MVRPPTGSLAFLLVVCALLSTGCNQKQTPPPLSRPVDGRLAPGLTSPKIYRASEVKMADDEQIVGVVVDGTARAYLVEAFGIPDGFMASPDGSDIGMFGRHVVNDVIGNHAISIAHCDENSCTTVFTADDAAPIDLSVAGFSKESKGMELSHGGQIFTQENAHHFLDRYEFESMTWADWLAAHPVTGVYLGSGVAGRLKPYSQQNQKQD